MFPELLVVLPGVAVELELDQLMRIAGAMLREQVVYAARRHSAGKTVAMRDQPGGHIAAVGAAGHRDTRCVDPTARDRRVDAGQDIRRVGHAPVGMNGVAPM